MLNKTKLVADLTVFFSDLDPAATAATKALKLAAIIDGYVKTGSIKTGTLSSSGTGNLGAPVSSNNITGGEIE